MSEEKIIIINPKNEEKCFSNRKDYLQFLRDVNLSNTFNRWCNDNNMTGEFNHLGNKILNVDVIEFFLIWKGYKIKK